MAPQCGQKFAPPFISLPQALQLAAFCGFPDYGSKNSVNNASVVSVINMLKPQKIGEMKVASPPPPPRVKHPLVPPPLKKSPDNWNIDLDYEEYVKSLKKLR